MSDGQRTGIEARKAERLRRQQARKERQNDSPCDPLSGMLFGIDRRLLSNNTHPSPRPSVALCRAQVYDAEGEAGCCGWPG